METRSKRRRKQAFEASFNRDTLSLVVEHLENPRDVAHLRMACKDFARWIEPKEVNSLWCGSWTESVYDCGHCSHSLTPLHSKEVVLRSLRDGVNAFDFQSRWSPPKRVNSREMYRRYDLLVDELEEEISCRCEELLLETYLSFSTSFFHSERRPDPEYRVRCKHEVWCLSCLNKLSNDLTEQAREDCDTLDSSESGDDLYPANKDSDSW